jgi:hypothetical protein
MATRIQASMTAADFPAFVFTAYADFWLRFDHTAGASVVALQMDLYDDSDWHTVDTFTLDGTWIVEVPVAAKFRAMITTLDTGPVEVTVYGKLNLNDTIGGFAPAATVIDENGDQVLEEDGVTQVFEEAA